MLVTYLGNDGFSIELDTHILLFDYYIGELPTFNSDKPLYVFVSHSHRDHYNPAIYTIKHPTIQYILADDVDNEGIKMGPNQSIQVDDLYIQTLLSTDIGVAFVVTVENKNIYHSGDLNWWHWQGEPEADNRWQELTFKQEINKIKHISFDLMMIPLDPRLKKEASLAIDYILQNITTTYVLPMHCLLHLKTMNRYLQLPPLNKYSNILSIETKGQTFTLK